MDTSVCAGLGSSGSRPHGRQGLPGYPLACDATTLGDHVGENARCPSTRPCRFRRWTQHWAVGWAAGRREYLERVEARDAVEAVKACLEVERNSEVARPQGVTGISGVELFDGMGRKRMRAIEPELVAEPSM